MADYTRSTLWSNVAYLVPNTLRPAPSYYRDNAHSATALLDVKLPSVNGDSPKLTLGGSLFSSSGSRPTRYYQPIGRFVRSGEVVQPKEDPALGLLLKGATLCNDAALEQGTVKPETVGQTTSLRADIAQLLVDQTNGLLIQRNKADGQSGKGQLYYTAHLEWFHRYLGGAAPPWLRRRGSTTV